MQIFFLKFFVLFIFFKLRAYPIAPIALLPLDTSIIEVSKRFLLDPEFFANVPNRKKHLCSMHSAYSPYLWILM